MITKNKMYCENCGEIVELNNYSQVIKKNEIEVYEINLECLECGWYLEGHISVSEMVEFPPDLLEEFTEGYQD